MNKTTNCSGQTADATLPPICGSGGSQHNLPASFTVTDSATPGSPGSVTLNSHSTLPSGNLLYAYYQYGTGVLLVENNFFASGGTVTEYNTPSVSGTSLSCSPYGGTFVMPTEGFGVIVGSTLTLS